MTPKQVGCLRCCVRYLSGFFLKRAVHRRFPLNLPDLEHFYKEEYSNIDKLRFAMLIKTYPNRLNFGTKSKTASTKN